ncbi:hypothetical protein [Nocardioides terrisoli]|uniref:hypothetical protein n=1 Tax=Nocardioides terrisoli TaxID=3388267 RepID=UPI00287B6247|nr:hypothetical protein [Nocardioides marmorisolisilvae]
MTAPATLHAAADRLRTLAQATDGEWYSAAAWATASPMSLPIDPADAAYIAAMSPPVALAVADLLDAEANRTNTCRPCDRPDCEASDCRAIRAALAVAEAIGGGA